MNVAEFLAYDDGTLTRYELIRGVMVATSLPDIRHAELVGNLGCLLGRQLMPPCRVYQARVGVAADHGGRDWRMPDLVATSVRPEPHYIQRPRLLVEVLSPSTEKDDRTTKLDFYETLPSLEAVLLVWQDEWRVRLRSRGAAGWVDQDVIGSGTVAIPGLGVSLSLDEIYADPWDEAAPGEA